MLLDLTITEGCQVCIRKLGKQGEDKFKYGIKKASHNGLGASSTVSGTDPSWFSLEDDDIRQFCEFSQKPHDQEDAQLCSNFEANYINTGIERLGFSTGCQVCLELVRAVLFVTYQTRIHETKSRITSVQYALGWNIDCVAAGSLHVLPISLEVQWLEEGEANTTKHKHSSQSFNVLLDQEKQEFLVPNSATDRFNPKFLKALVYERFGNPSDVKSTSVAEIDKGFPQSFRLIDVSKRCVVKVGSIRMKYSAISYRWDNGDKNMLTEMNKAKFGQPGSLSLQTMSKTLYDCMELARDLDIPYIWVDRYCIIQNNNPEKMEQIEAMGYIYANSWLTIICALTEDIHTGLPGYSRDFPLHLPPDFRRECHGTANQWKLWSHHRKPQWMERGWTMQEEYLSVKRLYVTECSIMWHIRCPTLMFHDVISGMHTQHVTECCLDIAKSLPKVLETYTDRELTNKEDRINAISGLLKVHNLDHLYGIATRDIRYNLSWFVTRNFLAGEPLLGCPTWSWAHLHQKLSWPYHPPHRIQPKTLLLHAHTPERKRIRMARSMGLSLYVVNNLNNKQIVVLARIRPVRAEAQLCLDDSNKSYSRPLVLNLRTLDRPSIPTYSLVIEPFKRPTDKHHIGGIHARRIGMVWENRPEPLPWRMLIRTRPMALQSMTLLKNFRLRKWSPTPTRINRLLRTKSRVFLRPVLSAKDVSTPKPRKIKYQNSTASNQPPKRTRFSQFFHNSLKITPQFLQIFPRRQKEVPVERVYRAVWKPKHSSLYNVTEPMELVSNPLRPKASKTGAKGKLTRAHLRDMARKSVHGAFFGRHVRVNEGGYRLVVLH